MSLISLHKIKNCNWPSLVLGILLIADVLFILGHIYTTLFWELELEVLLLDSEGFGFPEGFQYVKYLGIMMLIAYLISRKKQYAYLPLFPLFMILLIDDALQLHRWASWFFVHLLNLHSLFGIRASSLGLLIYTASMAFFFLVLCLCHNRSTSESTRKSFFDIFLFLGIFLFFGVGVDLLHEFVLEQPRISFILTLLEESGEMLTLSILVWYFCRLILTPQGLKSNLWLLFLIKCKLIIKQSNTAASY